jgi:hypothetical protein
MSDSFTTPSMVPRMASREPPDTAVRSQSDRQSCLPRRPEHTTTRPSTKLLRISHELSGTDVLVFRPSRLHPGPLGPVRHQLLFSSSATTYTTKQDALTYIPTHVPCIAGGSVQQHLLWDTQLQKCLPTEPGEADLVTRVRPNGPRKVMPCILSL